MKSINITRDIESFTSVTSELKNKGYKYEYKTIKKEIVEADSYLCAILNVPIASKLFLYKKVRIIENIPMSIETIYIEYNKVKGIENLHLENTSFYEILKKHFNLSITGFNETINIVEATDIEKELLKYKDNYLVLGEGLSYIKSSPFEYFKIIAKPNFFTYRSVTKND